MASQPDQIVHWGISAARVRSDAFYAATARQIGRESAGLPPGPGFDIAPVPLPSPLPPLRVDEIAWAMTPAETIPAGGGDLRATLIAYRELALAGCHALHGAHKQIDRCEERYHRTLDELKAARAHVPLNTTTCKVLGAGQNKPQQKRLAGLSGVQGVR